MAKSFLFIFFCCLVVVSCTDNKSENDPILHQAPYSQLTDSINLLPDNASLYYRRGSLFYHNNNLLHAEADLRKAWLLEKSESNALGLITVLKEKGTDTALQFIQTARKQLPESPRLLIALVRALQQQNKLQEALAFTDTLTRFPEAQLDALLLKSEILKSQNKMKEAIGYIEVAHQAFPDDLETAYNLAYEYAEAKNRKALALADTLLKQDPTPDAAKAYYVKATYYYLTNAMNDAIKNYDAAIVKDYNFLDAYIDKGKLLFEQKKYEPAMKVFEKGLLISPSTAEFFLWQGKVQDALGEHENAKLNYQRAYALDKTLSEAKELMMK